ncbi:hypothetical protein [Salinispira pacifica]|uniref:Glycosyltransferase subfamily 4-like N-terminal domain-containing protein n=1 Tax=Salinispira pacifica TaxID=1307761 RepID=V5WLI8_9SPIO|nr:hypothetical protein [Salinispira pacifica]AHC16484.1 hypothetical protein L21SP2_3142 [Salinispira pacifica]
MKRILFIASHTSPSLSVAALRSDFFIRELSATGYTVEVVRDCAKSYKSISKEKYTPAYSEYIITYSNSKILNILRWILTLIKVFSKGSYDLCFCSGGPFFYFPIAATLSKIFNIPCVLDFRDPWIVPEINCIIGLRQRILFLLQNISMRFAILVINVQDEITDAYKKLYGKLGKNDFSKFITIRNGYIPMKLHPSQLVIHDELQSIKIVVLGKLAYYSSTDCIELAKAIKELNSKKRTVLWQFGEYESEIAYYFDHFGIPDRYINFGRVRYEEMLSKATMADIMIVNHRTKYALGTKTYDYIYLNKPIIGMVNPDYGIHKLLERFPGYRRARMQNDITKAIVDLVDGNEEKLYPKSIDIGQYSRKSQSELLVSYINSILGD